MAKFYGPVGYGITTEGSYSDGTGKKHTDGVWSPSIVEKYYAGNVIQNSRKTYTGESTNDNIDISNRISILADPYAMQHFHTIKYVKWMGAYWKVTSVEVQHPRLILSIGGVYNGETAATT